MKRLQRAAMARTKPRNRAWQRAGTRGLSGPGPALGPAHAPTPAACAERYPDPPRSLAASHPATTDTGRQPGAGTPRCSSLRAMIVDHRASPAVAGFQRVHDQGTRPPAEPPVCQPVPCSWQVTAGTHRQGRRRLVGGESRRAGRRPRGALAQLGHPRGSTVPAVAERARLAARCTMFSHTPSPV